MIIPREVNNRTTKKRIVELCTNDINDINRCKIKPGESGQKKKKKADLTWRNPLRTKRLALDCSAT